MLKKTTIILMLVILAILTASAVSAVEDNSTDLTFEDSAAEEIVAGEIDANMLYVDENSSVKTDEFQEGYVDVTEAYDYLNEFRTQRGVWRWEDDNERIVYYNTNDDNTLQPFEMDQLLVETAKIRAKELVQLYDHVRPDGSSWFSIYPELNGTGVAGENIAIAISAWEVTEAWKETFDPYNYQGHRRNMLNPSFNCVGIAGYRVSNGDIYWVQAFGNKYFPENKTDSQIVSPEATFADLNDLIAKGTDIRLDRDYAFFNDSALSKGIVIDKSITLDGQGHVIDASRSSRIFNITADNVVFKNIIFKNAYIDYIDGGAIHLSGNNLTVLNCTFTSNFAYYGSAVFSQGSDVSLSDCTFTDNHAVKGAVYLQNGFIDLKNCSFTENDAILYGACVSLTDATLTASGCIFTKSYAFMGGAFDFKNAKSSILDSEISDNEALSCGGAVYCNEGDVSLLGCEVINNSGLSWMRSDGGAIYSQGGSIHLKDSTFRDNTVHSDDYGEGGAVFTFLTNLIVEDCIFQNNNATLHGGAIYSSNGNLTFAGSTFEANTANLSCYSTRGGAMYLVEANASFDDCTFTKNAAEDSAGVYSADGGAEFRDCVFNDNLARDNAGAIYLNNCRIALLNNDFTENRADYGGSVFLIGCNGSITSSRFMKSSAICGGAIYSGNCNVTFTDSTFEENRVYYDFYANGGVIFSGSDEITFLNCSFKNNLAKSVNFVPWGGSAFLASSNALFKDCIFENDSAGYGGAIFIRDGWLKVTGSTFKGYTQEQGTVYMTNSSTKVTDSRFTKNSAYRGGAMYLDCGHLEVSNSSFEDNHADFEGGAIYSYASTMELSDSLFNGNDLNSADISLGGAVSSESCAISIDDCIFTDNYASFYGGAFSSKDGNISAVNCSFKNNTVRPDSNNGAFGGAFYSSNSNVALEGCVFTDNLAESLVGGYGGGVCSRDANAYLSNCIFENNTADYGGAAYGCDAYLTTFTDNFATTSAGAMYGINSTAERCGFTRNVAYGENPTFEVETINCTFEANRFIIRAEFDSYSVGYEYYQQDLLAIDLYGQDLISNATVTLRAYKNNVLAESFEFLSGEGWIVNITEGDYTFEFSVENQDFEVAPVNATVKILKKEIVSLSIAVDNATYSDSVIVNLSTNLDGFVNFYVDGADCGFLHVTAEMDVQKSLDNVLAGNHTLVATITPVNSHFDSRTYTRNFTVFKKQTFLDLDVEDTPNDENVIVSITASEDGYVNVNVGEYSQNAHVNANEKTQVNLGILRSGTYKVSAAFSLDENYISSNASKTIKVYSIISREDIQITSPQADEISISLPGDTGGTVTLTIAGGNYTVEVVDGVANVRLPVNLTNGDYPYTIAYSGDAKYLSFVDDDSLKVNNTAVTPVDNETDVNGTGNATGGNGTDVNGTGNATGENTTKSTPEIEIPSMDEPSADGTVTVSLPADATGTVTLTVDGKDYVFDVVDGKADVKLPELGDGDYPYTITYSGDGKYSSFTDSGSMKVNNTAATPAGNETDVNGTGNVTGGNGTDVNGTGNATGENTTKSTPEIEIPSLDEPSADGTVTVTLPVDATGTVTLTVDGKDYVFDVVDGKADVKLPELGDGDYPYTITYSGDGKYSSFTGSGSMKVNNTAVTPQGNETDKNTTENNDTNASQNIGFDIEFFDDYYIYGETNIFGFMMPKDIKGSPIVLIDGRQYSCSEPRDTMDPYSWVWRGDSQKNGYYVCFSDLNMGNHEVVISYPGDSKYASCSINKTITVHGDEADNSTKPTPEIEIPSMDEPSADGTVTVTLPADASGTVTLTVDGKDYVFDVVNGKAEVKLPELGNGDHNYTITYSGDSKYASFTSKGSMNVNKTSENRTDNTTTVDLTKITVSNLKVTYSAGQYCTIKVIGADGKAASGETVKLTGKISKELPTNANGIAKFKVTQKPGSYKFTVTALGKNVTKTLTVKHLLTLKTVTVKKSAKKLVLQASLGKVNGKYLKGKKITFKFNGKVVGKVKTNSKGVAKVTVKSSVLKKLKVGKTVAYQATYGKDTVKKTAKVKK